LAARLDVQRAGAGEANPQGGVQRGLGTVRDRDGTFVVSRDLIGRLRRACSDNNVVGGRGQAYRVPVVSVEPLVVVRPRPSAEFGTGRPSGAPRRQQRHRKRQPAERVSRVVHISACLGHKRRTSGYLGRLVVS
jgi:hypothetical protein